MSLPPGWGDRTNQMSEHDIKLGGVAANKFATKQQQLQRGVYSEEADDIVCKTSDEVRQLYLKRIEVEEQAAAAAASVEELASSPTAPPAGAAALSAGWEDRQKARAIEAKQYGAFSRNKSMDLQQQQPQSPSLSLQSLSLSSSAPSSNNNANSKAPDSAEETLVRVAAHTLDGMASALERNPTALSAEDRTVFAAAMKPAMDAISRQWMQSVGVAEVD